MTLKQVISQKIEVLKSELSIKTLILVSMIVFGVVFANIIRAKDLNEDKAFGITEYEELFNNNEQQKEEAVANNSLNNSLDNGNKTVNFNANPKSSPKPKFNPKPKPKSNLKPNPNPNNFSKKSDSDCPINIQSDSAEFNDLEGIAIYKGNVIAIQGSRRLNSDALYIYKGKDNKIDKIIAKGNPATIKAKPNPEKSEGYGYAETIKYYPDEDKADLIDKAKLEQNGDVITGPFLTYFFEKGLLLSRPVAKGRTTVILKPRNSNSSSNKE